MKKQEIEEYRKEMIEEVYKKSWTYLRLSEDERKTIIRLLYCCKLYGHNERQICETLNDVYTAFLMALGYRPSGWRGE